MIPVPTGSKTERLAAVDDLLSATSPSGVLYAVEAYVSVVLRPDETWVTSDDRDETVADRELGVVPFSGPVLDHLLAMDVATVIEDADDCRSAATDVAPANTGLPTYRSFAFVPVADQGAVIAAADEPNAFDAATVRSLRTVAEFGEAVLSELDDDGGRSDADRRLERIRRTLSHDLIQPIMIARGNLDLAREEGTADRLETVETALDRVAQLARELETIAATGSRTRERETIDVASIAQLAWELCEEPGTVLEIETERTVEADGNALCHVFENLFRNAIEHGARTVRVEADGDVLSIEDDGSGIPPGRREAVFESGYSTKEGHTGEGLPIVHEIVSSHGWHITVVDGETGGARFEIAT